MAHYRNKSIELEAVQWDGENLTEIESFVPHSRKSVATKKGALLEIDAPHGLIMLLQGDYICKRNNGFFACKANYIDNNFEKID